jgi:5'-nucleotidase
VKINILAAALLTVLTASTQAAEKPLRILLVNDDGCQSVGTTSLQEKLAAKGYDVWMVAPDTNQSGIGSAITFKPGKTFDVKKVADKRYCFPGTPADAVDFGLWGVMKEAAPDLVISGVNDGPNTGMAQVNSGTVSAAARALRYGFPAIAASIGYRFTQEEMKNKWPSTHKYWPDSVDYVVTVVDKLNATRQPGVALLPKGSGLSINYPPLPTAEIKGVHYIDNQQFPTPQIGYELQADGTAKQTMNPASLEPTTADNDSGWLNKGYITYTLFDGSWNAPQFQAQYEKLLGR